MKSIIRNAIRTFIRSRKGKAVPWWDATWRNL